MEFDEYEYLEETVGVEQQERNGSKRSKDNSRNEKSERSYRRRDGEREEEEGGDEERGSSRSKRSRGDGVENGGIKKERDKDRHRSSRDRDRESDRDREKDKDGSREGSREKNRDRDRSSRERERKDRDRERRERERERRESERDRERRRSSSRSRRDEMEVEHERESRRYKDKKETMESEVDPERDQRTVFAYQMPLKATERDVYEFFSKAGKVRDVRLIMDRNSRRSKGVGYIEFYDVMSVPMAIALSGQLLLGQPVMVKPSEAEKNLVQSNTSTVGGAGATGPVDRKLYVGNLHFNMTELQLRQIFEPFGPVELVQLPLDLETGQCKGFGFIQFAQLEHAKAAQNALNGKLEIAGRTIKVSSVTDHVSTQDTAPKSADFDDDDGGGLALNAQSRALLMQKLDRSGIATSIASSLGIPALNGAAPNQAAINLPIGGHPTFPATMLPTAAIPTPAIEPVGQPSECLLLKNMFDPVTEMEPDFDLDIKEDVEQECSKYGRVKHIYVDKNSAGFVYLRFESVEGAAGAQRAMHTRWFAQRMISAIFMSPHEYEAKFKT